MLTISRWTMTGRAEGVATGIAKDGCRKDRPVDGIVIINANKMMNVKG